jgi:hypothetical protein
VSGRNSGAGTGGQDTGRDTTLLRFHILLLHTYTVERYLSFCSSSESLDWVFFWGGFIGFVWGYIHVSMSASLENSPAFQTIREDFYWVP